MINKFRYKKPPQAQSKNSGEKECSDNKDNTLTRKDKVGKIKIKDNKVVLSGVLDGEAKKKIKELFSQLQFSPETALPPDALRRALAESFFDQQRFQLGFMDDAAECFENMLLRIHQHVAHGQAEDACAAPHCVPHQKFAMTLVEQAACGNCGATSEPLSYTQMVHYVSTSTLVYQVRTNAGKQNCSDPFGKVLQKAGSMGDIRQCPSSCGSVIQIGRTLMNHPEIVSVGLVWNSERPTLEHIMEVFSSIGTSLRLGDLFNNVLDSRYADSSIHNLVGVVTYYGKHYSTFFFHTKLRVWIYFDDATVREVGPRWEQVVEKCRKGRYQPLLLLYSAPDGTPVNTDSAPKQITPFYTDKTKAKPIVSNQQLLRRSVTPSPEKPNIGNTRRAITPNPESSLLHQKPPLPRPYNEYQNLSVIQKSIYPSHESQGQDQVDGCIIKKEPEYVTKKCLDFGKAQIHRTLSNGSSSGVEGMCIPDHLNLPRRRDSGNWSGDRNSASSASSTTMENPYLYLVGKMPHGGGSVPSSPTRIKSDSSSGSSGVYDAGYDSYSLSSNDSSSMSTLQHLMKMGHLAKIPEDYTNPNLNQVSQSCDVLCDEADELLVKSRQLEDEHDLVLALALCNAAATKARAAMNAPYNNPQTLTLARMKHNTCIMRARSLHRRMTQTLNQNKDKPLEIRHTREGSSGSGRHSRQNSREKGQHSRQSSRELLLQQEKEKPRLTKSIEIYATLPKKKDGLKTKINPINIDDAEYMLYDKLPERESRSIFSRSKNKDNKNKEKRSRSEDRNKLSRGDFSIAPEIITGKDTLKKAKDNKEKEDKKDKDGKPKKQHKIRRKLLMGGLIRRKNRSMPDLTDANVEDSSNSQVPSSTTTDDSKLGLRGNGEPNQNLCGYLSEGHLEFAGNNANPNLERSKLMRKSFHCSAGKILTAAKVPPPPPLRTTSQLSKSKLNASGEVIEECDNRPFKLYGEVNHYHNLGPYNQPHEEQSSMSLPYYHNQNSSYDDDSFLNASSHTVITQADVHQEQSFLRSPISNADSGVDEVDCMPPHSVPMLELPPYPSPIGSAIHSRQASEDFPPPPPPIDLSALEEYLPKPQNQFLASPEPNSLLAQLQNKRQQILSQENDYQKSTLSLSASAIKLSGDVWLKELQAKQATLRMKKNDLVDAQQNGTDEVNTQRYLPGETKVKSVKDLASKFEYSDTSNTSVKPIPPVKPHEFPKPVANTNNNIIKNRDSELSTIAPEQIAEEIREVEMITSAVNKVFGGAPESDEENKKPKVVKKKSVSFCDQVILVATADEQEDDTYIPNPILERVLRSAVNKPEAVAIRQEILSLRDQNIVSQPLNNQTSAHIESIGNNSSPLALNPLSVPLNDVEQPVYIRRNSVENLLNRQNMPDVHDMPRYSSQPYSYGGQAPSVQNSNFQVQTIQPYPQHQPSLNQSDMMPDQQYYASGTNISPSPNGYSAQPPQSTNNSPALDNAHQYNSPPQTNNVYYGKQTGPGYSSHNLLQNGTHTPTNSIHPQYDRQNDVQQFKQALPLEQQYKIYQTPPYGHQQNYNSANQQHPYALEVMPQHHNANQSKVQQNGHYIEQRMEQSTPYRQSPYQPVPSNAPIHPTYYGNNRLPPRNGHDYNTQNYSPSPRPPYSQPQIRQSTPSPINHLSNSPYNHPPSPAPSSVNSNYNYHPSMYRGSLNNNNVNQSVYQRVPPPNDYLQTLNYGDAQHQRHMASQERNDVYQRVPPPHGEEALHLQGGKYSPYQQVLPSKQILKKTVSFEPGTKGCDSPIPKAIVTPIIVNNANNSIPTDKTKCNLCRKKNVVSLNLYCTDCEFYMSRFKPRS